jgi:hypothetical protein
MVDTPQPRVSAPRPSRGHCAACGYDLRGSESANCPECGAPCSWDTLAIHDPQQYHLAKAALERDRVLLDWMDPTVPNESNSSLLSGHPGWLMYDRAHRNQVEEILDELGIVNSINVRPIVDRAEPQCPRCDMTLDARGPEECPKCGCQFMWITIVEGDPP